MGGYTYGASIIEYIDKQYGFAKVIELYRHSGEYYEIFGISKDTFEKGWKQFLNDNHR